MRIRSRFLSFFLTLCIVIPLLVVPSHAASYSADWRQWSQDNSDDPKLREWGCWVVAQAKLLRQAGVVTAGTSEFNPDTYFAWEKATGHVADGINQAKGGVAPEA